MHGVLVIDKPAGPTSHDVVARIRKALKEKKVGHTGTLDPMATGVLPLVIGNATKVARYLTGGDKTYRATIRLGTTTTTLDAEGETLETRPVETTIAEVQRVLASFVGAIEQVPPMYSAKKIEGQRLYELARQGIEIEREAKHVTIYEINFVSAVLPDVVLDVRCSAGTYVRVLAQDVGQKLGCGGHLRELRRMAAGPFVLADSIPLQDVVDDPSLGLAKIVPVEKALSLLPRIAVPADVCRMIKDGYQLCVADLRTLDTPRFGIDEPLALATDAGEVIAVVRTLLDSTDIASSRRDRRALKTERVLAQRRS